MPDERDDASARPDPEHATSGIASWLIPEAMRRERSFRFGIAVAGLSVLVALAKVAFSSPSEALFAAGALLGLMFIYVIFNRVSKSGPKILHAPALALTWGMVVLFFSCAAGTVSSALFDYPKKFPALIADIQGKSAPPALLGPDEASRSPKEKSGDKEQQSKNQPSASDLFIPVTIKAVYEPNFRPATQTILTVRTADGKTIRAEMIPDNDGVVALRLLPNKYVLTAIGSAHPLEFEVSGPRTDVAIRINRSITNDDPSFQSETVSLEAGTSAHAMDKKVVVSVVAIDFGSSPLRHRVTFVVGGRGISSHTYTLADVGQTCTVGAFEVLLASADTYKASFIISKR